VVGRGDAHITVSAENRDAGAFGLNRCDQEELWGFVPPLLTSSANLEALWRFTNDDPIERAILLAALQAEADKRGSLLFG
jgi:hypothetical protein